jgi:hypothetical protein
MGMTNIGEAWEGDRPPQGTQLLPLHGEALPYPDPDIEAQEGTWPNRSLTHWEYLALARCFRKWQRVTGYEDAVPKDAYHRWCKASNLPHVETDGCMHLPGYALL